MRAREVNELLRFRLTVAIQAHEGCPTPQRLLSVCQLVPQLAIQRDWRTVGFHVCVRHAAVSCCHSFESAIEGFWSTNRSMAFRLSE